jgi:hypothetical protein
LRRRATLDGAATMGAKATNRAMESAELGEITDQEKFDKNVIRAS